MTIVRPVGEKQCVPFHEVEPPACTVFFKEIHETVRAISCDSVNSFESRTLIGPVVLAHELARTVLNSSSRFSLLTYASFKNKCSPVQADNQNSTKIPLALTLNQCGNSLGLLPSRKLDFFNLAKDESVKLEEYKKIKSLIVENIRLISGRKDFSCSFQTLILAFKNFVPLIRCVKIFNSFDLIRTQLDSVESKINIKIETINERLKNEQKVDKNNELFNLYEMVFDLIKRVECTCPDTV